MLLPLLLAATALADKQYWQIVDDSQNLLKYFGAAGPYVQNAGFGIDPKDLPDSVSVDMAWMLCRHGERYPSESAAEDMRSTFTKLKSANASYTGPLAFVKDWRFYIENNALLGLETNTSQFSGIDHLYELGTELRAQYGDLYDENQTLPIFSAGYRRVVDSAVAFSAGFAQGLPRNSTQLNVIPEEYIMGRNTLEPYTSCYNWASADATPTYNITFMAQEAARLNKESPGFNVTADDVYNLAQYCAFEMNAHGHSAVCDVLSWNTFVEFEYANDANLWYSDANSTYSFTVGAPLVNATATLFSEDPANHDGQKLWFNFAHDDDILYYANALGIFDYQKEDLPLDRIAFGRYFRMSDIVPMGAHLVVERLSDSASGEKYVRVTLNDAVIPLPSCQDGPSFTCRLSTFQAQLEAKMSASPYEKICGGNETVVPAYMSLYWDWRTAGYADTL